MMPIIKICGLRKNEPIEAAVNAGATHLGFVFHPKSPRFINVFDAVKLAQRFRERVKLAALVCDPAPTDLQHIQDRLAPDIVQFHGSEHPVFLKQVSRDYLPDTEIWKALGIATAADLATADAYQDDADLLLFDARPPAGADRTGGHGRVFDWSLLQQYGGQKPWLLAGGLTPTNITEAINQVAVIPGFAGVDVSSGVEVEPGQKDPKKIKTFIDAAQTAMGRATT